MNGHSKLRDLDFLKKDINKLGDYQFFTVNEYINDIKRKLQNGSKVPKFYKNLYEEFLTNSLDISENQIVENNELAKNPVKIALSEIPLSEIQYYVDKREYQTSSGHLGRNGIASLGDLYSFDFRNMKLRKNLTGSIWQEFICANYEEVISAWKDYTIIFLYYFFIYCYFR